MKTPSVESFHSTQSQQSLCSGAHPPPTISGNNSEPGFPISGIVTHHYVGALNTQCQALGLCALYEIDGDQSNGFGGHLTIGDQKVSREERWPSKKAAKEGLAQRGIDVVEKIQARQHPAVVSQEPNWTSQLNNFHQASGDMGEGVGVIYTEYNVGSKFACTCKIPLYPRPFGSETETFPSKKAARTKAAKEAMQFLITKEIASPDGQPDWDIKPTKSGKNKTSEPSASAERNTPIINNKDASFAQKVSDLCPELGLNCPQYRLNTTQSGLYSGAAYFPEEPLLRGPIGDVQGIFGRKNAREECARNVHKVLKALAARRGLTADEAIEEHLP